MVHSHQFNNKDTMAGYDTHDEWEVLSEVTDCCWDDEISEAEEQHEQHPARGGRPYCVRRVKGGRWEAKLPRLYSGSAPVRLGQCDSAEEACVLVKRAIAEAKEHGVNEVVGRVRQGGYGAQRFTPTERAAPIIMEPSECVREPSKQYRSARDKAARKEAALAKRAPQRESVFTERRAWLVDRIDRGYQALCQGNVSQCRFLKEAAKEAAQIRIELGNRGVDSRSLEQSDLCGSALRSIWCFKRTGETHDWNSVNSYGCSSAYSSYGANRNTKFGAEEFLSHCVQWDYCPNDHLSLKRWLGIL